MKRITLLATLAAAITMGCADESRAVLGTLERDRITLPAPVSERIAEVPVTEGQAVAAGETVVVMESARVAAQVDAARATLQRLQAALEEARRGPRDATIAEARARLAGAHGVATNARLQFERTRKLVESRLVAAAALDEARARLDAAESDREAAAEALRLLEEGTRAEQVAQAEAAVEGARAELGRLTIDLQRTRVVAPRAAVVDALPWEAGDEPPAGSAVATLLVGDRPHARVYVPQSMRLEVAIGTPARVTLHGSDAPLAAHVRAIRSEPAFTPYYALTGRDVSRLSWLAEVELDEAAPDLPVGVPVSVEFGAAP